MIKPRGSYCRIDADPLQEYINIIRENKKPNISFKDDFQKEYIKKRPYCISFLKNIFSYFNFQENTYFLSVTYMDEILLYNHNVHWQLIAIGSFLLAGIFLIKFF